ncbi:MAG: hypothetical protein EOO90_03740 [Pedobacter sp.]|nr:MAG: hypothetical protein EOO90_03740 [Pedobacter sp.]
MKITLTVSLMLLSIIAYSQKDPCKDVKKNYDEFKKTTTYKIKPINGFLNVELYREISAEKTDDRMLVHFPVSYSDYDITQAFIKFNGDKILPAKVISGRSSYISGSYHCMAVLLIDDDIRDQLLVNRISKFRIGAFDQSVNDKHADKTIEAAKCIFKD